MGDPGSARFGRLRRRRGTHSYAYVLALVAVSFLYVAIAPDSKYARGVLLLIESATLVVALWTSREGPVELRVGVVAVVAVVAVAEIFTGGAVFAGATGAINGLLVVAVAVVVARGVAREGEVNMQSVIGAVCVYLLAGMFFAFLYTIGAVAGSGPFFAQGTDGTPALRLYYSFVTLTTTGYGDYSTSTNVGHTLSIVEALFGQLYLVTVVALLVSRMSRRSPAGSKAD